MKIIYVSKELEEKEIFEYLKNKIKLGELIELNNKLYRRVRPINNKYYKNSNCFIEVKNEGKNPDNCVSLLYKGKQVLHIPNYEIILK